MDSISAGLFPISFNAHIIFTIISVIFFLFQYKRQHHLYQLLSAIAIPLPLILYLNSSSIVFKAIGFIELVMVIVIGVMLFSSGKKESKTKSNVVNVASVSVDNCNPKEESNHDET
ncbi:MAG: hypothetical protein LIO71_06925 [Ruminococcus sp.]|nr:hypothetical protein [Ruminococcus sp.]